MSFSSRSILSNLLQSPHQQQTSADLAAWLWVSATPREEVKAAWDAEIARRIAEIDAGTAELIPSEEAFARMEENLRKAGT